jgi:diaminohydroxyphosphoribosylaminopyrimidine deaminase / 5-amino-6-(5-phosphoribosylamino)uracil reductase
MKRALDLAAKGWPAVSPNPMVGCVIVHRNEIVSEGFHECFGGPHAEVNAIRELPEPVPAADCELYVTLEPCSHFGKTPPCADLIIQKGFQNIVICNGDPNPLVAGKGIEALSRAGITVVKDVLAEDGRKLNRRFFTFHEKKRPYIILKWAETADGFISRLPVPADRAENIISTPGQLREMHSMRAECMAVMVGKNTVLADNPSLTTRLVPGKNPVRVVLDRELQIPRDYRIFDGQARTIIFNSCRDGEEGANRYIRLDYGRDIPEQVCTQLYLAGIQSLMVEGGTFLLESFFEKELYDEVKVFRNPDLLFGQGIGAPKRK